MSNKALLNTITIKALGGGYLVSGTWNDDESAFQTEDRVAEGAPRLKKIVKEFLEEMTADHAKVTNAD